MFNTADVLIDEYARPIFVIEEALEPGDMVMELHKNEKLVFKMKDKTIGTLNEVNPSILSLALMQDDIGVIAYPKGNEIPTHYTHVSKLINMQGE